MARAITHRILARSTGSRGLFVRCARSSSSIAAAVRGKWTATAFAQFGSGWPPPDSAGGIRFQHSASLNSVTALLPSRGGAATVTAGSSTAPINSSRHSSLISNMDSSSIL